MGNMNIQETRTKVENHIRDNKKVWMGVLAGVLILIIVILALAIRNKRGDTQLVACAPGDTFSTQTGEPCPGIDLASVQKDCFPGDSFSIVTGEPCPGTEQTTPAPQTSYMSYADALTKYQATAIKLDGACHGTPATLPVAPGTLVMIANDSLATHAVSFAGRSVNLRPYHYDLIILKAPTSYEVLCNGALAGTIAVQ